MRKKVIFGIDYTDNEFIKIILYLFVGGTAALVEWGLFYLFFYHVLAGVGLSVDMHHPNTFDSTYSKVYYNEYFKNFKKQELVSFTSEVIFLYSIL